MIQFQENTRTDGRTEGWTDPTLQDPSSYYRGSTNVVDWHLKVKDIEYNVSLTKNCCITHHSLQAKKLSSIHELIFKIEQILGFNEMVVPTFDQAHPKIIEINFSCPNYTPMHVKISFSHVFILEILLILKCHDQTDRTHFWSCPSKKSLIKLVYVNLYQHTKNQAISMICCGDMIDQKIWLVENILAHISWTKILPNMGFELEHSK